MADLNRIVKATQIGDDADAEGADATVVGYDDFGNGRHTYGVATQRAIHPVFCRCLEGRSGGTDVDAIDQSDVLLLGNLRGEVDELVVVGFVHVREAWTCGEVLATQRMLGEEVDVVGDNHQVANLKGGVHASGRIADEEGLDAQLVHDPYGECHFLHGVALVVVETALHGHDIHPTELTENQLSAMSLDSRHGEVGNIAIGKLQLISYF